MNLKKFVTDEDAVSPVIGVILMVAITVILAAVIGTFVLGLGQGVQSAPQAQFTIETANLNDGTPDNDAFTITHDGGDTIESDNLDIVVDGDAVYEDGSINTAGQPVTDSATIGLVENEWGTEINAGDGQDIVEDGGAGTLIDEDKTVRVIWQSANSDKTQTLAKFTLG
jgi:flagellin-like protein